MISCDWQNPPSLPMIRTSTLGLSFFAAFTASGLSLGLFQLGVWANMFDQFYEETSSVLVSAERVFDGQHRCEGCEFVTDQGTSPKEALSSVGQSSEKIPIDKGVSNTVSFFNPLVPNQSSVAPQTPLPVFEKTETPPPRLFV
jgi:hypothetical protein